MSHGYSEIWHRTEAEWSKEPKPESDLERRVRELQAKQPVSMKPKIDVKITAPPNKPWEMMYD